MAAPPPSPSSPGSGGIHIGDVGGSVNFSALGDIVGGDKITTITTTIQISVEAITQRPLITTSPYRGLDRFEDRDKDLFFGRDQLIKSLLAQLSASNVLLVLGASGSGKSSVVRAGLLPQLSQLIGARFRYFTFVPDVNPFESLRSALLGAGFTQAQTRELGEGLPETATKLIHTLQRSGEQWLLFVDQFEEIFTVSDEKLRADFIAALVRIAQDPDSSAKLVLAMRADFLDRFSPFPQFAKIVEKNIDFVADMHPDELRLAIEQPAARHGVVFEQGLVEEIIKDVQGQAGSLPLLQYTLDLLWQEEARQDGLADRHLNTRAYRELGGVRGALQKRADEIYDSFGDGSGAKSATPKQEIVRQIFLRLVDLAGEGSNDAAWRPVRRRASMAMFAAAQDQEILQSLINQKLLVSNREGDDATVEVAHEALFTSWGRLKNWIEAGKQVIFARNRLGDDARRWQRRQREGDADADEELLAGSRLSQALDVRARGDFNTVVGGLGETEAQFLDASAALRDRRRQEEQERQQRELAQAQALAAEQKKRGDDQARSAKRLRRLVFALAGVFALAVAAAVLAWAKQRQAEVAQKTAEERRRVATARQLETFARTELDDSGEGLVRSVLLSVESLKSAWTLEGHMIWGQGMNLLSHRAEGNWRIHTKKIVALAFSRDGRWLASEDQQGGVSVWDPVAAKPVLPLTDSENESMMFAGIGFSPDEKWLVTASRGDACVRNTENWNIVKRLRNGEMIWAIAFSPNSHLLATASYQGGQVHLYETQDWDKMLPPIEPKSLGVRALAFLGDNNNLITSDGLKIWDVTRVPPALAETQLDQADHFIATALAFSKDRRSLVAGNQAGLVRLWETQGEKNGHQALQFTEKWEAHRGSVSDMDFSSEGQYLAITNEKLVRIWNTTTKKEVTRIVVNARSVAFSPDEKWLATGNEDGTVSRWSLVNGQEITRLVQGGRANAVAFSPDGQWLVTGGDDLAMRIIRVGNLDDWHIAKEWKTDAPVSAIVFSPDAGRLLAASGNVMKVYEPSASWRELAPIPHAEKISLLTVSPGGRWMITISGKTIKFFDCGTLRLMGSIDEEHPVDEIAFSPDQKWLVTRTHGTTTRHVMPPKITRVWDTQNFQAAASQQTGADDNAASENSEPPAVVLTSAQKTLLSDSASWPDVRKERRQSPDRRWLVDDANDATLLEAATGRQVNTFAHDDTVSDFAFSPNGRWLATASHDHTVRIWALKTDDLIEQACARLPRNLTHEEWKTYMGNEAYSPTCPNLPVPNE